MWLVKIRINVVFTAWKLNFSSSPHSKKNLFTIFFSTTVFPSKPIYQRSCIIKRVTQGLKNTKPSIKTCHFSCRRVTYNSRKLTLHIITPIDRTRESRSRKSIVNSLSRKSLDYAEWSLATTEGRQIVCGDILNRPNHFILKWFTLLQLHGEPSVIIL